MSNLKELSKEEKNLSYSKYYNNEMAIPPQELIDIINKGTMELKHAVKVKNRDDVLKVGNFEAEVGYCSMDDGTVYIANVTKMPGVTAEMIEWWFAWHGLDPLRYKIWNRDDHFDLQTTKRERLLDSSIPVKEKIWGVSHTVVEDTGFGAETIEINFENPSDIFSKDKLEEYNVKSLICGNGTTALMCHIVHETEDGIELRSRFWIGYIVKDGKVVRVIPEDAKVPGEVGKRLALHCIKEYTNLASFLPNIYIEEKDIWK